MTMSNPDSTQFQPQAPPTTIDGIVRRLGPGLLHGRDMLVDAGTLAFEEAVEKAVIIASWMPRKKNRGLMPPKTLTEIE